MKNFHDITKDELIREVTDLKKVLGEVKEKYDREISQLRLAEEELSKSEEKFRKAFITSPDSININRLEDGMYVSINSGFTKTMGYTEGDVLGKTSIELNIWNNPDDRKKLIEGLKSKGEVENLEATFVTKNSDVKYGMMSAAIINLDGVPHILSITRDITDRKYASMALQESENRYRELIELAVDGILLGSPDGIIIGANSCIIKLSGRSRAQILGMHVSSMFDPEEIERKPLRFDLLQKGEVVIVERNIIRPDGSKVPVEMHTKMMPDNTYQSIFHDITERREAESALRESEEWFRTLFEQSSDGILYLTLEGEIVAVNKSFASMHGYTLDEIMKMNIADLDCIEARDLYPGRMKKLIEGENLKFEVEHFHRNGSCIPLEVTAGMIALGSRNYIMASHRDITARKKAEEAMKVAMEKAEASDRLKTSFLNNISHEVRTPLNGIIGFAEIITRDSLNIVERNEALSMVYECSDRLLETITNYMDISLLVSGEMTLSKSEFNPHGLLKELFETYEGKCETKNLKLILSLDGLPEDAMINSDPELIRKALSHMLNNAVKFTEQGSVDFGCKCISGQFQFHVSDTGIGIGKSVLNEVFNHFVKEDQVKSRRSEGSGLGLSIAKGIVELLGGAMSLQSDRGKGTSFTFTLPSCHEVESNNVSKDIEAGNMNKKLSSILVAEDDEANFLFIKALLRQNTKAEIIYAANGREAIEKFKLNRGVDLILMDMKMPDIDGFEATKKIKSIDPEIPIIAVTAYAMLGDERRILDAGCDEYLSKPITKITLFEKISKFVSI